MENIYLDNTIKFMGTTTDIAKENPSDYQLGSIIIDNNSNIFVRTDDKWDLIDTDSYNYKPVKVHTKTNCPCCGAPVTNGDYCEFCGVPYTDYEYI